MSYTAAVITVSDKASRGERIDTSGPAVKKILEEAGFAVVYTSVVPDEAAQIQAELISCADEKRISLIMTTGGTGFSPRDLPSLNERPGASPRPCDGPVCRSPPGAA